MPFALPVVVFNDKVQFPYMVSGRSRGVPSACTPLRVQILSFDIQNFQNVAASGVGAPLRGWRPPTGNPGSAADGHTCV